MIWIPGGTFRMGSDKHYPEEAPVNRVTVGGFWIDRTPVTNREFRKFVNTTGHITFAEIKPDAKDYPGALPHMLKAGSLVFTPPKHAVNLPDWSQWWNFGERLVPGGADEFFELSIGYRGAVDPETVDADLVGRRFFRIMLFRAHAERVAGYPNHVRRRRLLRTLH